MPRALRVVAPGVACHVTQRSVDHRETFSCDVDRATYLTLLKENLQDVPISVLAWCIMPNHVHLVATPEQEDSLAIFLRRVHGRYAQYYNARTGRTGHLWQSRYFACALGERHLWRALAYVERNPVRAGLARRAGEYRWSSAVSHISGRDKAGILDMSWWAAAGITGPEWAETLGADAFADRADLERCTYSGKPYGDECFVEEMSKRFGRHWVRGRPPTKPRRGAAARDGGEGWLFEGGK